MARKYAAVVAADRRYLPGVNGLLNSLEYYGNDLDFHFIYIPDGKGGVEKFVEEIKNDDFFADRFFPVTVQSLTQSGFPERVRTPFGHAESLLKFYRYLYVVERLSDYKAVVIFDADIQVVNNIMRYLDIVAETERLLVINNDYTNEEHDNYSGKYPPRELRRPPLMGGMFWSPRKHADLIRRMVEISGEKGTSDMISFNYMLIENDLMKEVILLPALFWLNHVHYQYAPLFLRVIGGKRYLALNKGGERIYSFHRRWWSAGEATKWIRDKRGLEREIAYHNFKLFFEMTKFLNLELRHVYCDPERWGTFPEISGVKKVFEGRQGIGHIQVSVG